MRLLIILAIVLILAIVVLALVFRNSRKISINVEVRHEGEEDLPGNG